jgi:hypothetical protein
VHTAAADTGQELGRTARKAEAGAHFLVTDVIYDAGPAARLLRELRSGGIDLPVIASFAPFADPQAIARLIHEIPGTTLPAGAGTTRATPGDAPADPVSAVLDTVSGLAGLIAGVLIQAPSKPDERLTDLLTGLATIQQAS